MHILYISQYFPPEAGATQTRAFEMAQTWVAMGHSVTMLTEFPNHPSGIISPKYRGKLYEKELLAGIDIIRVWIKASPNKNIKNRMLFYLSFMVNAILAGIFLAHGRYDFIYATSPPLFVGGAALVISYIKRKPLIFEVRDLWPESAVELGELSHPAAISWAKKLEGACYARARKIIVVTNGILNRLVQRSIQNDKLILIPNGANTTMFVFKSDKRATTRKELGLEGKFIAVYAGIFGLAQHLETIVETARILKDNRKIYFILIGDGPQKKIINTLIQNYSLPNLCVLPEQPRELIPGYLSAADVSIIPLKKAEIFKGALPSKIFDAWSCSLPVLISIDGEARDLVDRINAGRYVDPENPEKMAEALVEMSNHKDEIEEMGRNGRTYVEQYHSRQALAKKLIEELAKIIDKNG